MHYKVKGSYSFRMMTIKRERTVIAGTPFTISTYAAVYAVR